MNTLGLPTPHFLIFTLHSLNDNNIGAAGAAAIGEVLQHTKTLTELQ